MAAGRVDGIIVGCGAVDFLGRALVCLIDLFSSARVGKAPVVLVLGVANGVISPSLNILGFVGPVLCQVLSPAKVGNTRSVIDFVPRALGPFVIARVVCGVVQEVFLTEMAPARGVVIN